MSYVAVAVVGSAAVGAYTSYRSSKSASKAAGKATDAQVEAEAMRIEHEREMFDQHREDLAPWRDIGESALRQLQAGISAGTYDPGTFNFDFEADPGYQFRLTQGVAGLDASAASRGRLLSGAQDKAVTRYGQELGSLEYGNAFNRAVAEHSIEAGRRSDQFNRLAGMAGIGQTAVGQTVQAGQQAQQNIGNALSNQGAALAQGHLNQGAARQSMYQGVNQAGQQGVQNYLLYNYLKG